MFAEAGGGVEEEGGSYACQTWRREGILWHHGGYPVSVAQILKCPEGHMLLV